MVDYHINRKAATLLIESSYLKGHSIEQRHKHTAIRTKEQSYQILSELKEVESERLGLEVDYRVAQYESTLAQHLINILVLYRMFPEQQEHEIFQRCNPLETAYNEIWEIYTHGTLGHHKDLPYDMPYLNEVTLCKRLMDNLPLDTYHPEASKHFIVKDLLGNACPDGELAKHMVMFHTGFEAIRTFSKQLMPFVPHKLEELLK